MILVIKSASFLMLQGKDPGNSLISWTPSPTHSCSDLCREGHLTGSLGSLLGADGKGCKSKKKKKKKEEGKGRKEKKYI